jgi:hypothetical protein
LSRNVARPQRRALYFAGRGGRFSAPPGGDFVYNPGRLAPGVDAMAKPTYYWPTPLKAGETAAIAPHTPKTAALCFDRVWGTAALLRGKPPRVGWFCGQSAYEFLYALDLITATATAWQEDRLDILRAFVRKIGLRPDHAERVFARYPDALPRAASALVLRDVSEALSSELNRPIIPVYAFLDDRDREFTRGDVAVVTSLLSGLQVVDEAKCEWEQVLEFRRDVEVRDKYKRFLHWL